MKRGLKEFGEAGVEAVLKELKQLHVRNVIEPKNPTHAEKKAALQYLMFLKQKRTGEIKGRGCATCLHCERRRELTNCGH
jgi:hypothetical protein